MTNEEIVLALVGGLLGAFWAGLEEAITVTTSPSFGDIPSEKEMA